MVNQITTCGLIVTHSARSTELLDEFIALCDWPLVTRPSTRSLFQQIEISRPLCLAFWLDALGELAPAAKLIAQLRARGPRPYRIAVAHNLAADVEHTMRAAGVHTYLATSGNVLALVEGALLPFIDPARLTPHIRAAPVNEIAAPIRGPTEVRGAPAIMRPP